MRQIGTISNPLVNGGAPVPLYEMSGDINTIEGSRRIALKLATPRFIAEYGREPVDDEEVLSYNDRRCREFRELCERKARATV